jgi:hypothetical protein
MGDGSPRCKRSKTDSLPDSAELDDRSYFGFWELRREGVGADNRDGCFCVADDTDRDVVCDTALTEHAFLLVVGSLTSRRRTFALAEDESVVDLGTFR